jgi:AcrR family transcriptional regulator
MLTRRIPVSMLILFGIDSANPARRGIRPQEVAPLSSSRTTKRLNREEKKAETKARLLDAARRVFAAHGFQAATVDQIADEAGYSKGAVYSNFSSKEDLYLSMLEQHFEERRHRIAAAVAGQDSYEGQTVVAAAQFMEMVRSEPEWTLLFMEVTAYASRNPELQPRLAQAMRGFQETVRFLLEEGVRGFGIKGEVPSNDMAIAVMALGHGMALHDILDPEGVADELYGVMLSFMLRGGLAWLKEVQDASQDGTFHEEIGDGIPYMPWNNDD